MSTASSHQADPARPAEATRAIVDYAKSLDCIHCGLCLTTCPTYQLSGAEPSSPRGRVHLMRAVAEGRIEPDAAFAEEMSFCLVCRHCESVCPAGVQFGAMMEVARDGLVRRGRRSLAERLARRAGFGVVLVRRRALELAVGALALAQRLGLTRLAPLVLGARGRALASFPRVPLRRERAPLAERTPARGERAASVALLEGCVMRELFGRVHRASAAALAAAGVETRTAPEHVCCGALHAHNGELDGARALARSTIEAFDRIRDERGAPLPVVVNSAGCGAHMKDYERLLEHDPAWRERARAFSARVLDLTQVLALPERSARLAAHLVARAPARITYDDPCHLCHGQQIRAEPRALLDAIPGLTRVELDGSESCCGSAGIYSLLRPEDSARILATKLAALAASGAGVLVTANPGCHLQWQSGIERSGLDVEVVHVAELLARHLERGSPAPA